MLTDGGIVFTSAGDEIKKFNIQDGMGITLARQAGLKTGIITSRVSDMVKRRAEELKYDVVIQRKTKKIAAYDEIKKQFGFSNEEICYIGDDLPDLPVLKKCGFSVTVKNGRNELKNQCDYITELTGGNGAVREVIELILKSQNKFDELIKKYEN